MNFNRTTYNDFSDLIFRQLLSGPLRVLHLALRLNHSSLKSSIQTMILLITPSLINYLTT
jgi:hypothetical protein